MSQPDYEPKDRRPIASRNTRWAHAVAGSLAQRGCSPNGISLFGMCVAALAGGALYATSQTTGLAQRGWWLCAAALIQTRLLCNLLDGMVAVARKIASPRGELFNEAPDRVSDALILIGLGYAATGQPELGWLAALCAVFVAYVRALVKSIGAPNDFCGPMAKAQRMALVTALCVWLMIAPEAWRLPWGEARIALLMLIAGCAITASRRLWRAGDYLQGGRA